MKQFFNIFWKSWRRFLSTTCTVISKIVLPQRVEHYSGVLHQYVCSIEEICFQDCQETIKHLLQNIYKINHTSACFKSWKSYFTFFKYYLIIISVPPRPITTPEPITPPPTPQRPVTTRPTPPPPTEPPPSGLGEQCRYDSQCGVAFSLCINRECRCMDGYFRKGNRCGKMIHGNIAVQCFYFTAKIGSKLYQRFTL